MSKKRELLPIKKNMVWISRAELQRHNHELTETVRRETIRMEFPYHAIMACFSALYVLVSTGNNNQSKHIAYYLLHDLIHAVQDLELAIKETPPESILYFDRDETADLFTTLHKTRTLLSDYVSTKGSGIKERNALRRFLLTDNPALESVIGKQHRIRGFDDLTVEMCEAMYRTLEQNPGFTQEQAAETVLEEYGNLVEIGSLCREFRRFQKKLNKADR